MVWMENESEVEVCVRENAFGTKQKREVRKVRRREERGCVYVDVCITEGCSSIKRQPIYIGSVEVVTDPFSLEGVLYIKLTSHVSISVSTRMIFA